MEIFTFGERLMIYRKRAGLTKKELAEKTGVTTATISKYENDITEPDYDTMINLALTLNVSVNRLLLDFEDIRKDEYLKGLFAACADRMAELKTKHLI